MLQFFSALMSMTHTFGNAVILLLILFILHSVWQEGAPGRVRQEKISGSGKIDSSNFHLKFCKMSFEFDPNDDNDRAVDGNDFQDIGSLGGVLGACWGTEELGWNE